VDLFSGCGGLSLGVREACRALGLGFQSVLAVDANPTALDVYAANFAPSDVICGDLSQTIDRPVGDSLSASERSLMKRLGSVDIVLAGPPCQGHSNLNNHTRRNDIRNALYSRVIRFVELVRPSHVVIENVPSVVHATDGVVAEAVEVLGALGYGVSTNVVQLDRLGVPQRRKRHVLVASLTGAVSLLCDRWLVHKPRSVMWAIHDLEQVPADTLIDTPSCLSEQNIRRIKYLMRNGLYDLPDVERPPCHRDAAHSYKSMYGRLRYTRPAQTITTGFGSPGQGRFIHPTQCRTLTPHEAARLQGFPDFFNFSRVGSKGELADMIGNAVPMRLGCILGLELLG
jgi:DNA (cytosine-5)-methyltransferase 1